MPKYLKLTIMKKTTLFLILLVFTLGCQQTMQTSQSAEEYQAEVKEAIAESLELYNEAWENEDLDSSLFFYDEDAIYMFCSELSANKEKCREIFQNVFDTYSIEGVEWKSIDFVVDNDYAFDIAMFKQEWITNDKQDTLHFQVRMLTVFKKQDDGSWKIFRILGQNKQ